ncbi:hypothetical protein HY345_01270 [Candidatus Microgenomates bacterium]|nr:hypothetical protein [Candidatus Microgenomates bacterium]
MSYMRNFNRDNRSGGRRNFGPRRDFGDRNQDRQMHKTVCSNCGKECEVPFKPSGDKPVYCSECFGKIKGDSDSRRFGDRDFKKPNFARRDDKQPVPTDQLNSINAKLDKILTLLNNTVAQKLIEPSAPQTAELIKIPQEKTVENPEVLDKKPTLPVGKKTKSVKTPPQP